MFDIAKIFDEVRAETSIVVRDPMLPPFGDPDRITATQKKAWDFYQTYRGLIPGMMIGLIGAKGSAKTHFGACFAMEQAQIYPGSLGCLISNSYPQAKDNAGPILIKVCKSLGYDIEFFTQKKIRGRPFTNVFVIKLAPGIESFVLVRSFDAITLLEGVELDWGWMEEIQDADPDAVVVFVSRIRGENGNKAIFAAAMPEDENHYQYKLLPGLGFVEEAKFNGPVVVKVTDPQGKVVETTKVGIMYEPSVFENVQNVGTQYIERLLSAYTPEMAERYVYGRRGSVRGDRVFYRYRSDLHRNGPMSEILCHYDPTQRLVIAYDFNVYPMSAAAFQPKLWNDAWFNLRKIESIWYNIETGEEVTSPEAVAMPNRTVWAQVNEWEVYPDDVDGGMTRGMVVKIEREYLDHGTQVVVIGDASGNQRRSSSDTTDWQIIGESMRKYREPIVVRGLISNMDVKAGLTRYSNPSQRDALQNANRMLMDATGQVHVCFLPTSKFASGGVAGSVSSLSFKPDGSFDTGNEKKLDRAVSRSHFSDVFKYFGWFALPPTNVNSAMSSRQERNEDGSYSRRREGDSDREVASDWAAAIG